MTIMMCEKLSKRSEEWNHIYPFLEWLQEQGIVLARYEPDKYFEIDPVKLEEERRELLKKLREGASEK